MDRDILKSLVSILDENYFLKKELEQKNKLIEQLKNSKSPKVCDEMFLNLHKDLIKDYNKLKNAALEILEASLGFDCDKEVVEHVNLILGLK